MMKKVTIFMLSLAMTAAMLSGCSSNNDSSSSSTAETTTAAETTVADETTETEAAEETSQEETVDEEENYDTGDASLDNIRNQDEIGEQELLVLSFGTSYNDSRRLTVGAIENDLEKAFPDFSVRRGFTSNIIIDHVNKRDNILIDDVDAAMNRAVDNGVKTLVVQPTHLMHGLEYDELEEEVGNYADAFDQVVFGEPLLSSDDDFAKVEKAITEWTAEYDDGKTAICFMGHGTEADSNEVYQKMQDLLTKDGYANYFVGTVEATPSLEDVLAKVQAGDYERVVLEPLMVVAGDHANNDMAGGMQDGEQPDADSFAGKLQAAGYRPECVIRGIGEYPAVREVYLAHLRQITQKLFCDLRTKNRPGILYGIGVGPGNPKLMTLQALETIRSCDLIVLPAVSKEECYAYRIVEQVCPEIADMPLLCMPFPMIKDAQKLELAHKRIYDAMEDYLRQGLRVGMLTIGDPGIYSTYMYMHRCAADAGWEARIVSGVPSFCAVAARLGISLGEKDEEIHIIPAAYSVRESLGFHGTRIYMKSGKKLEELLRVLRESMQDKESRAHQDIYGISNCGMENEQVYCGLDELEQAKGYLTTVIVKEHVVQ